MRRLEEECSNLNFSCRAEQLNGQSGEDDIFINVEDKLTELVTVLPFQAKSDFTSSSSTNFQSEQQFCLIHQLNVLFILLLLQILNM